MIKNDKSRRQFLKGLTLFSLVPFSIYRKQEQSKEDVWVNVIDKDGKVYKVRKSNIPVMCVKKVSNKRLLNWLKSKKRMNREK